MQDADLADVDLVDVDLVDVDLVDGDLVDGHLAKRHPLRTRRARLADAALVFFAAGAFVLFPSGKALGAGSGMPWEAPLQRILESIEGPVAKVVAVVTIIMTGLSLAFGDMGGGLRRLIQIVFGLSIAFAATSFFLSFFAFAGGAQIK
jgi:type IV secretion system protein TrbC